MSVMSEIERIKNAKAALKTSIENKDVTVGDGLIDTYASKVDMIEGSDSHNAFEVSSVAEMNELTDVNDGDFCTIYGETLVGMTGATSTNVTNISIYDTITLSEAITSLKTLDLMVMGAGDRFVCNIYPVGMVVQYDIGGGQQTVQYTSADGITFTTEDFSGTLNLAFTNAISASSWDNVFTEIVMIPQTVFGGIYQASVSGDVVSWTQIINGGFHNAYKVKSIEERDALIGIQDGDVCIVQDSTIGNMTESTNTNVESFMLKPTVVLPEALSNDFYATFRPESGWSPNLSVEYYDNNVYIRLDDYESGQYENITYNSQDNITWTTQDISVATTYNLRLPVSYESDYGEWNDNVGYFLQVGTINFSGIYQASVEDNSVTWNYLEIGINSIGSDILLNKKGYTSNGIITGTRDIKKYAEKGYYVSLTEPTDPEAYPLWIKPFSTINTSTLNNSYTQYLVDKPLDLIVPEFTAVSITSAYSPSSGTFFTKDDYVYEVATTSSDSTPKLRKISFKTGEVTALSALPSSYTAPTYYWFFRKSPVINGKIYTVVYRNNYTTNVFYEYDFTNNTFTKKANIPTSVNSNSIYNLVYHYTSNTLFLYDYINTKLYKYSIANDTWTTVSSPDADLRTFFNNYSRGNTGQPFLNNSIYIYGGGTTALIYKETATSFEFIDTKIMIKSNTRNYSLDWYTPITKVNDNTVMSLKIESIGHNPFIFNISYDSVNNIVYAYNYKSLGLMSIEYYMAGHTWTNINVNFIDTDGTAYFVCNSNWTAFSICKLPTNYNNNGVLTFQKVIFQGSRILHYNEHLMNFGTDIKLENCYLSTPNSSPSNSSGLAINNIVEKVYLYDDTQQDYVLFLDYINEWLSATEENIIYFPKNVFVGDIANTSFTLTLQAEIDNVVQNVGNIAFNKSAGTYSLTINYNSTFNVYYNIAYTTNSEDNDYLTVSSITFGRTDKTVNLLVEDDNAIELPFNIKIASGADPADITINGNFLKYLKSKTMN